MPPITMSSSPTVIFHRHQQSTLVLLLLLSILLYISPIHCVKPKGESKALLRVLNDVDNVLSKETKVLEELHANRSKEKKFEYIYFLKILFFFVETGVEAFGHLPPKTE